MGVKCVAKKISELTENTSPTEDSYIVTVNESGDNEKAKIGNLPQADSNTPSPTVTDETTYGISASVGTVAKYSRGDHTHGTPATPDLDTLSDVVITSPAKNQRLIYNGTSFVNVAEDTSFLFSIASFTATGYSSGTQLAGTAAAEWLAIGAVTFSATYNNGPATGAYVSSSGHSNLNLASFIGPTTNAEAYTYPSPGSTRTVTLNSTDGTSPGTSTKTATFHNYIYYGELAAASGISEAQIEALANSIISGDITQTWDTVTCGGGEYWWMAWPTRLGSSFTFYDNDTSIALDVQSAETVSVTNSAGLTENYYAVPSTFANLGALTIRTT